MINNLQDLQTYLQKDKAAGKYGRSFIRMLIKDEKWKYLIALRKYEFHLNCPHWLWGKVLMLIYKHRTRTLGIKLGYTISANSFGPGLSLPHRGTIIVNEKTKVGANCTLHACVNIGEDKTNNAPTIGDRVYIGPGAKIIGGIEIADNTIIGANSVVTKTVTTPNTTIAGVPAKFLKHNN